MQSIAFVFDFRVLTLIIDDSLGRKHGYPAVVFSFMFDMGIVLTSGDYAVFRIRMLSSASWTEPGLSTRRTFARFFLP